MVPYDRKVSTAKTNLPEIKLRLLQSEDLPKFLEIRNSVSEMLHDHRTFTLAECRDWFASRKPTYFLVESFELGIIGYFRWSLVDNQSKTVEIGLDLSPEFQGRKWAKEIYAKFFTEVLKPKDTKTVVLRVLKTNTRAQNLYKDLGFLVYEETDIDYSMKADFDKMLEYSSASSLDVEH
jgi:RimJ/RimL family protein N-acetyltransferase